MNVMGENPIPSFRGVFLVALAALASSLVVSAVAIAEETLLRNDGEPFELLRWMALPMFWVAALNKPLIPAAVAILGEQNVPEWMRNIKLVCAFLGIGYASLPGAYLVLVGYGKAVLRSGGAFGSKILWYLKWVLLVICAVYGLIGASYLVYLREFLSGPVYAQALPATFGYFLLCLLQYGMFSLAIHWGTFVVHSWIRNRQRQTWR